MRVFRVPGCVRHIKAVEGAVLYFTDFTVGGVLMKNVQTFYKEMYPYFETGRRAVRRCR